MDSFGCSLLCRVSKLLAIAMLLTLCLQKNSDIQVKSEQGGGVLFLYDTKDTNHCHINPTVGLLSSALSFLFQPFSACRASTTFPHYFQFPQLSAFIFVLLTVQDTSVGKKGNLHCLPVYFRVNNSWVGLLSARLLQCRNCTVWRGPRLWYIPRMLWSVSWTCHA